MAEAEKQPETSTVSPSKEAELLAALADVKNQLKDIQDAKAKQTQEKAQDEVEKSGDVAQLKKHFNDQLATFKKERAAEQKQYKQMLLETEVDKLSKSIGLPTDLMRPHLVKRLDIDVVNGKPEVVVLDKSSKRTLHSTDVLRQEFVDDPTYAELISRTTGARGAGAAETANSPTEHGKPRLVPEPKWGESPQGGEPGQHFLRPAAPGVTFRAAGYTPYGGLSVKEFGQYINQRVADRTDWPEAMAM